MTKNEMNLISEIRELRRQQRHIDSVLLEKIAEVDEKRLYAELGYSSLYAWLTEDLKYSDQAACRRIQGARLLRSVPEVKAMVESGSANLTTLSKLQTAIRQEEKRTHKTMNQKDKEALVLKIQDLSSKETERVIAVEFPELKPRPVEKLEAVGETEFSLTLVMNNAQFELMTRVKEVASHSHFNASWMELIELTAKEFLKHKDPLQRKIKPNREVIQSDPKITNSTPAAGVILNDLSGKSVPAHGPELDQAILLKRKSSVRESQILSPSDGERSGDQKPASSDFSEEKKKSDRATFPSSAWMRKRKTHSWMVDPRAKKIDSSEKEPRTNSKPLSIKLRAQNIQQHGPGCIFRSTITGKLCGARTLIESDHKIPRALGGPNTLENLRPLCRAHNLLMAQKMLGPMNSRNE